MSAPKSVLITGCSDGGIGSSLARVFQANGLHVFATTRDVTKMSSLDNIPNITQLPLDITSSASITAAIEAVKSQTGGTLDYLVNNAALNYFKPFLDIDHDEAKMMF